MQEISNPVFCENSWHVKKYGEILLRLLSVIDADKLFGPH